VINAIDKTIRCRKNYNKNNNLKNKHGESGRLPACPKLLAFAIVLGLMGLSSSVMAGQQVTEEVHQSEKADGDQSEPAKTKSAQTDTVQSTDKNQQPGSSTRVLEKVSVSAQRTSIIDAHQGETVSASVIAEDDLREAGSSRRVDSLRKVPGVTVLDLGGFSNIVIRGTSTAPDGDPNGSSTAVYFDDIPLSSVFGSTRNIDLASYDIERVDVLRGPQGTASGGVSVAGLVRSITSSASTQKFSARVDNSFKQINGGGSYGFDTSGHINMPLIDDKLGLRFTGYSNTDRNPVFSVRDNQQGVDGEIKGGRLALRYLPNDRLTIDARYVDENRRAATPTRIQRSLGEFRSNAYPEPSESTSRLGYIKAQWSMDWAKLTAIASESTQRTDSQFSFGTFSTAANSTDEINDRSVNRGENQTFELRLSGRAGEQWDWLAGAYAEKRRSSGQGNYFLSNSGLSTGTEFDTDGIDDPLIDNVIGNRSNSLQKQYAIFSEVNRWLNDSWLLSVGLRWTRFQSESAFVEVFENLPVDALTASTDFPKETALSPKLALAWRPDSSKTVYAQYAETSRPGGNNFGALTEGCSAQYRERVEETYSGDQIKTLEAGAKLSQLGRGATVNMSVYYSHWNNAPVYTGVPCAAGAEFYIDSAKRLTLAGIEADFNIPIGNRWDIAGGFAYSRSRIAAVDESFSGGVVGEETPGNPKLKMNVDVSYRQPLGNQQELIFKLGASHIGKYKNGLSVDWSTFAADLIFPDEQVGVVGQFPSGLDRYNDPGAGGYTLFNASVGYRIGDWQWTLFADNLLNSKATTLINYLNSVDGEATFTQVTPRAVGLRLQWNY
jgi:iron complex outermembrane recepter protein